MNKRNVKRFIIVLLFIPVFFFIGCSRGGRASAGTNVIEIRERMFVGQVNDIYQNAQDYLGRAIKLEGVFVRGQREESGGFNNFVLRYGPGCCGDDGNVGFEVRWAGNQNYPEHDSWVEAVGELKTYRRGTGSSLYLELISLNVLNRRGAEFVN